MRLTFDFFPPNCKKNCNKISVTWKKKGTRLHARGISHKCYKDHHLAFIVSLPLHSGLVFIFEILKHENPHSFFFISSYFIFPPNKKILCGFSFSYSKNMANFEAFCLVISSSINLLFLKSEHLCHRTGKLLVVTFFVQNFQNFLLST